MNWKQRVARALMPKDAHALSNTNKIQVSIHLKRTKKTKYELNMKFMFYSAWKSKHFILE